MDRAWLTKAAAAGGGKFVDLATVRPDELLELLPASRPREETVRRLHLEQLRTALWQFAATHEGRFPSSEEATAIPRDLWEIPNSGGLRYHYVPGLSAGHSPTPVVIEPELEPDQRLVLRINGDILIVPSRDLPKSKAGAAP